jgi:hypothetical protein
MWLVNDIHKGSNWMKDKKMMEEFKTGPMLKLPAQIFYAKMLTENT